MAESVLDEKELLELANVGQRLASEIDLRKLLAEILDAACRLTDSPDGAVILYDPARAGLYFAAATGASAHEVLERWGESSEHRVPLESKAGAVFSSGRALVDQDLASDQEHFKGVDEQTRHKTASMVCVPLEFADQASGAARRIGVIQILNKRQGLYTHHDEVLLGRFAGYAALAIRNASLFRDLLGHMGLYSAGDPYHWLERLNQPPQPASLTILFADMRGFTQLCYMLTDPGELESLLSSFLTMLTRQILRYEGVVNKVLGDGVLAFFPGDDTPARAVRCAFGMLEDFDAMRRKWDEQHAQDLGFLDMGVGIVTGNVLMGTVGCGAVRDFTVLGTPVNLAAAFQNVARQGKRVLVDQPTLAGAKDLVGEVRGPTVFELRKPDQQVGIRHKQYHIVSLKQEEKAVPEDRKAAPLRMFLCHASEDKPAVRALYQRLKGDGYHPWLDAEEILGGQDWNLEIRKAAKAADVVLVCLSNGSVTKEGYLQRELRYVLEVAEEKPEGAIFLIPVRFEECPIPERLKGLQWVDLFEDAGYEKLRKALEKKAG
jgi:class 3 adenylate cyclase